MGDIKVFVEASMHDRMARRMDRKGRMKEGNFEDYFLKVIEPMHRKHVAPTKRYADIVIRN